MKSKMDQIYKNWNIEVGSPREFFREVQDIFLASGYTITAQQEPSLARSAMPGVSEFTGHVTSSAPFRKGSPWVAFVGLIMALGALYLFVKSIQAFSVVQIAEAFFLLVIGWAAMKASARRGTISTELRITGEAYQSRALAKPTATTAHERSGLYSRAKLILLLRFDIEPPAKVLENARLNCSSLESEVDNIVSKYVILRDKMLSDGASG
jgi:hypothetical protein